MPTTFDTISRTRQDAAPVNLFTFSGAEDAEFVLERMIRSVNIIPATTEFGYGTTTIKKVDGSIHENAYAGGEITDFQRSLDQLLERTSNLEHVSLVVAWHGTDLRVGSCEIKPKVDKSDKETTPFSWAVGPTVRSAAEQVSYIGGFPAVGGAPSDRSLAEGIAYLKSKGLKVTLYPFILMDVENGNALPNPYDGTVGQPAYPWRGRITCDPAPGEPGTVDQTPAAAAQVANFFGTVDSSHFAWDAANQRVTYTGPAAEWSFRRHILHLATIAEATGVDDFLIGTEMVELNRIRSDRTTFPAVDQFCDLADEVYAILGPGTKISYAADWSEWNGYRPADGTGDVFFHLDKLWSHPRISYIGIDNYMKTTDWQDNETHIDALQGWSSIYDLAYHRSNVQGGEDYDWFYLSTADRNAQTRTPITDGVYGEEWIFRQKDLQGWWSNYHQDRIAGVKTGSNTGWVPESKPIVFTELGCPAVNRGSNQPNVFVDPKSSESFVPYHSKEVRDDLIQRCYLEATLDYWSDNANNPWSATYGGRMLDTSKTSVWAWDARPFPDFPEADDFWGDAPNWELGHWLNGRINIPVPKAGTMATYRYTDAERPVTHGGHVYEPIPVKPGKMKQDGTLERSTFEITIPRDSGVAELFRGFRSAHNVMLTIHQGHQTDDEALFVPRWHGRVTATKRKGQQLHIQGVPSSTALARAGLTRNYQIGCPHVLYGPLCKADKAAATITGTVAGLDGDRVTLTSGWNAHAVEKYVTGLVEWTRPDSRIERRRILQVSGDTLILSGPPSGLSVAETVSVSLGCNQTVTDCRDLHNNIQNCGACPAIPSKNPLAASSNNFY